MIDNLFRTIARNRIRRAFYSYNQLSDAHKRLVPKYETYLGQLNVNYRETPRKSHQQTIVWNSTINERHATISITLSIEPISIENNKII